jgi:hypothetical protein
MQQLRLPAHGSRADQGALRQNSKRVIRRGRTTSSTQNQRIARVFAFQHAGQHNARRQFGFQILEAVHRNVNPSVGQCFMDFLGEKPFATNIGQSMFVGGIQGIPGAVPGRYAIADVAGDLINFTVAGWPASGLPSPPATRSHSIPNCRILPQKPLLRA